MTKNEQWVETTELTQYRQAVQDVLAGELDETRFQALRLQQGVYGQRQENVNMVRVKLPGGVLSPNQLGAVADVLDNSQS